MHRILNNIKTNQSSYGKLVIGIGSASIIGCGFVASLGVDNEKNGNGFVKMPWIRTSFTSASNNPDTNDKKIAFSASEFKSFPLISKHVISHNTAIYRFALPTPDHEMGLSTSSCIVARAELDGKQVSRPYTPVTLNNQKGHFDLIIKAYPKPGGVMSRHFNDLRIGETIEFKGPFPKIAYKPNMKKEIGMIAGGTGITPMLQVIREILGNPADNTKISLIFANITEEDILLREEIDNLASLFPEFKVYYTLDKPPKRWNGGSGFVSKEMLVKYLPKPSDDHLVLVCGPKGMLDHVSGPKGPNNSQGELGGLLKDCGYVSEQVYKF